MTYHCISGQPPSSIYPLFLGFTQSCYILTGMLFSYILLQLTLWWLFHATVMLWKLQFPFHARSFENSGRMKHIHIACIVSGLLIPTVSLIASMADFAVDLRSNDLLQSKNITFTSGGLGYGLIRSPPILCSATDKNTLYYSNIFPVNVMVIIGITELIFVFRIIHKVSSTLLPTHNDTL